MISGFIRLFGALLRLATPFLGIFSAYQGIKVVGGNIKNDLFGNVGGVVVVVIFVSLIVLYYLPSKIGGVRTTSRSFSGLVIISLIAGCGFLYMKKEDLKELFILSKAKAIGIVAAKKSMSKEDILLSAGYEIENDAQYVQAINRFITQGSIKVAKKLIDGINPSIINDNGGVLVTTIKHRQYSLLQSLLARLALDINNLEVVSDATILGFIPTTKKDTPLSYAIRYNDARATKMLIDAYNMRGIKVPRSLKKMADDLVNTLKNEE